MQQKTPMIRPLILALVLSFLDGLGGTHAAEVLIPYSMPRDAVLTLNITRPDGWVVRELIVGERKTAGQLHFQFGEDSSV